MKTFESFIRLIFECELCFKQTKREREKKRIALKRTTFLFLSLDINFFEQRNEYYMLKYILIKKKC